MPESTQGLRRLFPGKIFNKEWLEQLSISKGFNAKNYDPCREANDLPKTTHGWEWLSVRKGLFLLWRLLPLNDKKNKEGKKESWYSLVCATQSGILLWLFTQRVSQDKHFSATDGSTVTQAWLCACVHEYVCMCVSFLLCLCASTALSEHVLICNEIEKKKKIL